MVNQKLESMLSPEQRPTLDELREQLKVTSIRIARLNRELVAAERELLAEYTEARLHRGPPAFLLDPTPREGGGDMSKKGTKVRGAGKRKKSGKKGA